MLMDDASYGTSYQDPPRLELGYFPQLLLELSEKIASSFTSS